ncbi:MAG: Ger(x)C family spore germination protein [Oscillospiraceae bacterium]|nr:Ger(x)C family spore germination protein [Oscillospiraceae bacterium]
MRKIFITSFILLFLLTSCTRGNSATGKPKLTDRLIIEGIGIDYDNAAGEYAVTFQTLNTEASGKNGSGDEGSGIAQNFECRGGTVAEAVGRAIAQTGKKPLYGHNKIIIFGRSAAENGIYKVLDYFLKDYKFYINTAAAFAETTAAEILNAKLDGESMPAEVIEKILRSAEVNSKAPRTELYRFVSFSLEETSGAFLPVLRLISDEDEPEKKNIIVSGTAVFKKGIYAGGLTEGETRGFLWIAGRIDGGTVTVETENGGSKYAFNIKKAKPEVKINAGGEFPTIDISIKASVEMIESRGANKGLAFGDKEPAEDLTPLVKAAIENEAKSAAEKALKEYKTDIFRFGRRLYIKNPEAYRRLSGSWAEILPGIQINTNVAVEIL